MQDLGEPPPARLTGLKKVMLPDVAATALVNTATAAIIFAGEDIMMGMVSG
jgi:hypothetical protein